MRAWSRFHPCRGEDVTSAGQHIFDSFQDRRCSVGFTKVLEHQRRAPNLPDRIGDPTSGDVGRRSVNWLEQTRKSPFWVDVSAGSDADGAGARGPQVRQDVTEEIAGDNHVEPVGVQNEIRREDVDVELVHLDVGKPLTHLLDALVPVRHRDRDTVALRRRGQVPVGSALSKLERIFEDPVDADSGHHRFLHHRLAVRALEHPAADT